MSPGVRTVSVAPIAVLVALVCLPQLAVGMYVPALPRMATDLGSTEAAIQQTLVAYMAGYALSMLCAGLLADRYGRRPVLLGGLALFTVVTCGSLVADQVWQLDVLRFLQALGGCAGTVVARLIVKDVMEPRRRVAALTYLSTGLAITPAVSPLLGGVLVASGSWRSCFAVMLVAGVLMFAAVARAVPETLRRETAVPLSTGHVLRGCREILRNRPFRAAAITISLAWCGYFVFTLLSSLLLQGRMGMGPIGFATAYGCVVLGYVAGSTAARRAVGRWTTVRTMRTAAVWAGCAAAGLVALAAALPASPVAFTAGMAAVMVGVGAVFPTAQASSLEAVGAHAGLASGLFFAMQMASGALYGQLASLVHHPGAVPSALLIAAPCWALAGYALLSRGGPAASGTGGVAASAAKAPSPARRLRAGA
ncbi:multidrug effflux MFS transporter [Streptomyces sp. NPDC058371]|uniref:multidrug effflux MFS transporter n=1 Tax=Streptomyces sp. NPDC058371 TaxID=3346463 RepID=UPI0036615E0B